MTFEEARLYLIERAKAQGTELEVFAQRHTSTSIEASEGEVSKFKLSSQRGLGLRALVNSTWGHAYTENLTQAALDRALDSATENAELGEPQAHARLVAWGEPPELDLHGEGLSGVTVEQKVNLALTLERSARQADSRVVSVPYNGYTDRDEQTAVSSTSGLDREFKALSLYQFVGPLVSEHGQRKLHYGFHFTREFEVLDPTRTGLEATRRSLALLGAQPAPTGTFAAVIDAEAMTGLLSAFAGIFSAEQVQEGRSPLGGKLGQLIGSPLVTLIDDATLIHGQNSRPFDAEGCPSAPLILVEGGVFRSLLHNAETAARDGVPSTGHANRTDYKSVPGVAPSNLFLQCGQGRQAELLRELERGVLVTRIDGLHAGANPITGEFSLQAQGFWVEDGEKAHPLEVFTVAGNFLELLSDIQAVAGDLTFIYYQTGAPSVRLRKLMVGGSSSV